MRFYHLSFFTCIFQFVFLVLVLVVQLVCLQSLLGKSHLYLVDRQHEAHCVVPFISVELGHY